MRDGHGLSPFDVGDDGPPADGRAAWMRLLVSLAMVTVGGVGMWCVVVALPAVQAEFGVDRGMASLPYTMLMLGIAAGGVQLGRLSDRFGIMPVAAGGGVLLGLGFIAAALSPNLWTFALVHGLMIGVGASASFGPVMADISFWFWRRRGIAVAIVASGNYLAGAFWPPIIQWVIANYSWRTALAGIGVVCLVTIVPLSLALGRRPRRPVMPDSMASAGRISPAMGAPSTQSRLGLSPSFVQMLLILAGLGCCVAMSMPQVHIVAYCGDLGYGPARGAEMLSLMLGFGIISRVASGYVADRIGGLMTLLVGSALQCLALIMYLFADTLVSLYVVSILFGLFQGGIVPSYALIVRELFPPGEAGRRVGLCVASTLVGMALGGWLSGVIFDWTGSYRAAFLHGIAWNLVNQGIVLYLLMRMTRRTAIGGKTVPA
ncbi:MFS transporter [Enterovirga rhinocerotis]|uniref:Putative MFS family arabinose efflux permease n=1 Tax=Enterovirga rhinocerotis TaxID=1339210 RepID=A0A4R7C7V2_9HYPH|nr:MFS transporter [Enterovirga rhinocerotis]TDR94700.1 putative MFS family arabinose efflux permease [Enterovirga rhinocerotis]